MSAHARLEVEGLHKRFGGLTAVKDVGFSVKAGEILGLIGPNGSGKSTVMKSILGVERPDRGSVRIDGVEVAGWPPHRIARLGVGMVFQHSRPLHRQTVLENIILGLLPDKLLDFFPDEAVVARAQKIAERVGLGAVLDRRPSPIQHRCAAFPRKCTASALAATAHTMPPHDAVGLPWQLPGRRPSTPRLAAPHSVGRFPSHSRFIYAC